MLFETLQIGTPTEGFLCMMPKVTRFGQGQGQACWAHPGRGGVSCDVAWKGAPRGHAQQRTSKQHPAHHFSTGRTESDSGEDGDDEVEAERVDPSQVLGGAGVGRSGGPSGVTELGVSQGRECPRADGPAGADRVPAYKNLWIG